MTEPLCHHGYPASACTTVAHTTQRHCPVHDVGWSALKRDGCWETDDHGQPCKAQPMLGEPPRPSAVPDEAVVVVSREQQAEASWVLDERVEQEAS